MNPIRSALSLGLFIVVGSAWMLLMNPPGSGGFVASLIGLASGAVLVGGAVIWARRSLRHATDKEDK